MPALNRLGDHSHVFERAYVTQTVCTPSRSSLLTGLWPHQTGLINNNISLPNEVKCFPEFFENRSDYLFAHYGKWHLGDEIYKQHGFDEWCSTEDTYFYYYTGQYSQNPETDRSTYDIWLREQGISPLNWVSGIPGLGEKVELKNRFSREQICALPERFGRPSYLADIASDFIRKNNKRPFALYVNFLEPHMPFHGPNDNLYDPGQIDLPPDFSLYPVAGLSEREKAISSKFNKQGYEDHALNKEEQWRELISRYWGLCSQVDRAIGKILETLKDNGLYENTVICFTSDHGDMMGGHGLLAKGCQYEGAARVPLFIKLPGQKDQVKHSNPVSHIDLLPTLLEIMDIHLNDTLPGKSLLPLILGDDKNRHIFMEWNPSGGDFLWNDPDSTLENPSKEYIRTIIMDEWKFNWSSCGDHQLFNLDSDPLESINEFSSQMKKKEKEVVQRAMQRILIWQNQTDDKAILPKIKLDQELP